ncbi:MAG: hypothetical protein Kow0027_19410 [Saprospiraceae bacterium]
MLRKNFVLLVVLLAVLTAAEAQDAVLKGRVVDAKDKTPLVSATILLGDNGTISDLDGSFELKLPAGTYDLMVTYVGYEPFQQSVNLSSGQTLELEIELRESANLLQTATVTSGKHERALGEVTVSLDVIKPALLENTNQTSLDGLLEKVPGVSLVGDQANIRGGSGFSYGAGSRVLLLIDDMPIYQADAGFPQWEDVPLENVEQIEVVKGAASALYGSSALNGIINVRTAYAKSEPETKLAPFYKFYDAPKNKAAKWWTEPRYTSGLSFSHKRKAGKLDVVLGGYYFRNNSVQDSTMSRRGRFNLSTRYRITDRLSVGVNANVNKSKGTSFFFWRGIDSLIYRPAPGVVSSSENLRYNVDPFVVYFDPSNNRHRFQGRYFSVNNDTGTDEADQSNISDVYYAEYQFQRKITRFDLVSTAGIVYTGTKVRAPLYGDTTFTSRNFAGYLQLEKRFFNRLNVSAGFRFEHNTVLTPEVINLTNGNITIIDTIPNGEIRESRPVLRIGTSYELSKATYLRASWGQGYRFPTIAEKFIFTVFGGTPIRPNFDLKSETGWTAELGLRQGFAVDGFNGFLDLAAFWSEYQDMMEFNVVLALPLYFQSQNVGDTRIRGIEASITGRGKIFGADFNILAGYTFIDPQFKDWPSIDSMKNPSPAFKQTQAYKNALNSSICNPLENCENILKYRFKHSVKLDFETTIRSFSLGVSCNYNSFMKNIDEIFEAVIVPGLREFRAKHNKGDVILGFRAAWHLTENLKGSFLIDNALNREYSARPGKLENPRNYTLRVDYRF